ncbi:MAG: heme ABC transporter ATP-binding protein [Hyphomicrobiales bacterium]|nr:heme ABC transporter ATP-binding protein [Hyphomicrobiales bacterium]
MALELKDVSVVAGRKALIEGVSLSVHPGKLTVILGANGAGKSTALSVLAGDSVSAKGEARLDGVPLSSLSPQALAERRAVVLQHAPINFAFKVHEIVSLSRPALRSESNRTYAIEERALHELDLAELAGRSYPTLSGGERQRVQIARALAQLWHHEETGQSSYLLLDEPTAHLDLKHQFVALEAARRFAQQNGGVLCILHDLTLAREFADEIILMRNGNIAAKGGAASILTADTIAEIYDLPAHRAENLALSLSAPMLQ